MRLISLRLALSLGLLAITALLAPEAARAQAATVTITVTQADGQPAQFADVLMSGVDTATEEGLLTDENGVIVQVGVPPGTYKFTASVTGFVSDTYSLVVGPGARESLAIALKSAGVTTEYVEVDANIAELVDVVDVTTSTQFTGEFINKIPIMNRRIEDVVAMMPGVIRVGSSDSSEISIGGGTGAQIAYRINGLAANDTVDGGLAAQLPTAAIQSFKLISSGASARYGEQSTGVAEIVTKSGTNENDFTYELQFRDSGYGAQSLSGLDEAQREVDDLLTAAGSILESEVRAGFRLLGIDPVSTRRDDSNPPGRSRVRQTVSAGGPIVKDVAFFHSTLEVVRDDFGSPFVEGSAQEDNILWTSKVNWEIWEKDQASNRLEFTTNLDNRENDGFIGLQATRDTNVLTSSTSWSAGLTDTHVFPNARVLETKLSLQHQYVAQRPEDIRKGVGTQYQVALPPGGPASYFTGQANFDFDQTVTTLRAEANYSILAGSRDQHTLDIGLNADQTWFKSYTENGADVVDFRVVDETDFLGGAPTDDPKFVGREITYGPAVRTDDEAWYTGLYFSDSWQVTQNFTLQTGLRAEYQSFVGKVFLAPRIGFSLDPIGDGRTRFFGNWGIYYDRLFANFLQFTQNPDQQWADLYLTTAFAAEDARTRFSSISIADIYKDALTRTQDSNQAGSVAFRDATLIDRYRSAADLTAPTNKDWTLGLSRQLPGTLRLEVTYRSNDRSHQISNERITRREAVLGQPAVRDIVYGTSGKGRFQQWAVELQRPMSDNWSMNLSYVQGHNSGPIGPPLNPLDPNDVLFVDGTLGNDRTHVAKIQGTTKIGRGENAWDASTEFTWQSGLPVTARVLSRNGQVDYPIGRNTLRMPSARMLNFGVSKSFQLRTTADGGGGFLPTIGVRAQLFNLLNDVNVTGAIAQFEVPEGTSNPQTYPPLRADLITTAVDVPRSLEVGFSISF